MTTTLPHTLAAGTPENVNHVQANDEALRDALDAHIADTTDVHGIDDTSAVSPITVVRKTSDETVNGSTTLQDDGELLLTVAANEVWKFDVYLLLTAAGGATPDWKVGFTGPSASAVYWGSEVVNSGGSATSMWSPEATGNPAGPLKLVTGSLSFASHVVAGTVHGAHLAGIYVGGSNAGTLQFQWAQNTSNASDSKVLTNSCLIATQLA